jgi:hypothetical protein
VARSIDEEAWEVLDGAEKGCKGYFCGFRSLFRRWEGRLKHETNIVKEIYSTYKLDISFTDAYPQPITQRNRKDSFQKSIKTERIVELGRQLDDFSAS